MSRVAIGIVAAAVASLSALRARALTSDGAIAAFAVGATVFGAAGWPGAVVLLAFFIPSSLLSRDAARRQYAGGDTGKQGPRDAWQVLANGAVATLCALAAVHGNALAAAAFAGAFAAASADTWGTEIGTRSKTAPRSIVTLRPVAAGMSGGVTRLGTMATIGGAACVAAAAAFTGIAPFWPVAIGGTIGAFADSLLGATLQALRWCPACGRECETNPHACGARTVLRRGFAWIENDAVNGAATLAGAVSAGLLAALPHA